jgi:HPr kinase/phosphorylase
MLVHATCIAIDGHGVLLRGRPGSGKSDLALRLIDGGALLVADDQVMLRRDGASLIASAPPQIAGRLEVRGIGICWMAHLARVPLDLVVDLVGAGAVVRLPAPGCEEFLGRAVRRLDLAPFEASAAAKVRVAVRPESGDSGARQ